MHGSHFREVGSLDVLVVLNLPCVASHFKPFLLDRCSQIPFPKQDLRLGRVDGSEGPHPLLSPARGAGHHRWLTCTVSFMMKIFFF